MWRATQSSAHSPACAPEPNFRKVRRSGTSLRSRTRHWEPVPKVNHLSYVGDASVGEAREYRCRHGNLQL